MNALISLIRSELPLVAAATALSLGLYALPQKIVRTMANEPQVQMAEDGATAVEATGQAVLPPSIEMRKSLLPYVIVFDQNQTPVASSAQLDSKIPVPPAGTFAAAKRHGQERFSWQPAKGVRSAAVLVAVPGDKGFVLAGRSLREVEKLERRLLVGALVIWLGTLAVIVAGAVLKGPSRTGASSKTPTRLS